MKFTSVAALFFATASMVLATPTGHTFMRAQCDIAGCVAALAGTVVSCAAAAAQGGANVISDAGCLVAAANTVTNFPADCDQCAEEFGVEQKVAAAGDAIENAASGAVDDVKQAAGNIGDKIGGLFD